jgi:hypothetical protein
MIEVLKSNIWWKEKMQREFWKTWVEEVKIKVGL